MLDLIEDINTKQDELISNKLTRNKKKAELDKTRHESKVKTIIAKKSKFRSQIDQIKNSLKKRSKPKPKSSNEISNSVKKVQFKI